MCDVDYTGYVLYHLQQNFNGKFLNRKIKKKKQTEEKQTNQKKKNRTTFNGAAAVKLFCFGKSMRNSFAKDVCEGNVY